jgi:signal transduction histidine kinase
MEINEFIRLVQQRFVELALAPLENTTMIWAMVPLAAVIIFMTLYFARHRSEDLGWNTAFGNTATFLFMAVNLVREMYYSKMPPGWENVTSNKFYFTFTLAVAGASVFLMIVTYFHLLPKRLAFTIFSPAPINVAVYVMMAVVYAGVPADYVTLAAGAALTVVVAMCAKIIQLIAAAFIEDVKELDEKEQKRRKELEAARKAEEERLAEEEAKEAAWRLKGTEEPPEAPPQA